MSITLKSVGRSSPERCMFEEINERAFPQYERMNFDDIYRLQSVCETEILGIYDEDEPKGFIVLLKNEKCGYIYYLAVDEKYRSSGYGSAALKELERTYPNIQLILDFEEVKCDADNYEQRIKRKDFYLRNGFHETGQYTVLSGERFEVVCNGNELLCEEFEKLIKIMHDNRPDFADILI